MKEKKKKKAECMWCNHFDMESMMCGHKNGLLKGVKQSESIANAEHDCPVFKEAIFKASILNLAMEQNGVAVDFETVKNICDDFLNMMVERGILKKGKSKANDNQTDNTRGVRPPHRLP